jgi:hypothetical protein
MSGNPLLSGIGRSEGKRRSTAVVKSNPAPRSFFCAFSSCSPDWQNRGEMPMANGRVTPRGAGGGGSGFAALAPAARAVAVAEADPELGPNVVVVDPAMPREAVQARLDAIFGQQERARPSWRAALALAS